MIALLKSKAGTTLVELIIGMVVFAMVVVSTSIVVVPILKTYAEANEHAELASLSDNLAAFILNDLSQATEPPTIDDDIVTIPISGITVEYSIGADGFLYRTTDASAPTADNVVLSGPFYRNKTVGISEESVPPGLSAQCYAFRLSLFNSSGVLMLTKVYAANPIVLNQYNSP